MKHPIRIHGLTVSPSPKRIGWQRVAIQVDYGSPLGGAEEMWLEHPAEFASDANLRGDTWLLFLLPLAFTLRRALIIDLPVDAVLLSNAHRLMEIWSRWHPDLKPISLEATEVDFAPESTQERTGVFFSAGVDSFHSLLDHEHRQDPIDDLLFIHGFDMDIHNDVGYERVFELLESVATHYKKSLVPFATNLRQTRFQEADWSGLSHGCMLAGCGIQLSPLYQHLIISSTLPSSQIRPFGSHRDTDQLFSSSQLEFEHFGGPLTRYEKLETLIDDPFALDHLRVCFEDERGDNCGQCLKCVVVMTMLECYGVLEHCQAFGEKPLNLDLIRNSYISYGFVSFSNIKDFAQTKDRHDIIEAVNDALVRTKRVDDLGFGVIRTLRSRFGRSPIVRRLTRYLRPSLWRFGRWLNRKAT